MNKVEPAAIPPNTRKGGYAPTIPSSVLNFRWTIAVGGLLALALCMPLLSLQPPLVFGVLLLAGIIAELGLTVGLAHRRSISLSATFIFMAFLSLGAVASAVIGVIASLAAAIIRLVVRRREPHQYIPFALFSAGQLALGALLGGAAAHLFSVSAFDAPPIRWMLPLAIYTLVFLATKLAISMISTKLRYGTQAPEARGSDLRTWTALSFAICAPLALMAEGLAEQIGLVSAVFLTVAVLVVLRYVLQLTLQLERANVELRVLNEIGVKLAAVIDFDTLYPAIYHGIQKLMDAEVFALILLDDEQREATCRYWNKDGSNGAVGTLPYDNDVTFALFRSGKPLLFEKPDPTMLSELALGQSDWPIAAMLIAPLVVRDQLVGAIVVQSHRVRAYSSHQLDLLAAVGGLAAISIRNAQLFEREKALLREREEFVSLVAHELKNPLAAVSGFQQIVARRLQSESQEIQRPLQMIAEQTDRLNRLVDDLLDLSRVDAGRLALDRRSSEIRTVVHDIVEQQQVQTSSHQIEIFVAEALPVVSIDVMRMGQVLQNLIGNAIKYSPAGGEIDVRVNLWASDDPRWPVNMRQQNTGQQSWIVIEVVDHGIGIAAADLPMVFGRFYRATNTYDRQIAGAGLGLSIAAEFVRAHGGLIWATSEPGMGSTFAFALPPSGQPVSEPHPITLPSSQEQSPREFRPREQAV